MADLSLSVTGTSSISAYVYNLDTTYERSDRYIEWYIGTSSSVSSLSYKGRTYLDAFVSSSDSFTFSGLSAGTTYYVRCLIYYTGGGDWLSVGLNGSATTTSSGGGGGSDPILPQESGLVSIYANGGWHEAIPYVYANGGWHRVTPYVWVSGAWRVYN